MRWIAAAWAVGVALLVVAVVVMLPTYVRPSFGYFSPDARPGPPIFAVEITVTSLAGLVALYAGPPVVRRIVVVTVPVGVALVVWTWLAVPPPFFVAGVAVIGMLVFRGTRKGAARP
jgi:hypothetical protein